MLISHFIFRRVQCEGHDISSSDPGGRRAVVDCPEDLSLRGR